MKNKSKLLDQEVVEIATKELKKLGNYGYVSKKLSAVIAASKHSITEVAKVYNISRNTLGSWIKHIKSTGIENLKAPATRRRKQKIDEDKLKEIKDIIEVNPNITIAALKVKIEETCGIVIGKSTVHRIMHKLNYSYITPRPKHYKQNPSLVEEFKKKSSAKTTI